jgi:hypothetical protein
MVCSEGEDGHGVLHTIDSIDAIDEVLEGVRRSNMHMEQYAPLAGNAMTGFDDDLWVLQA